MSSIVEISQAARAYLQELINRYPRMVVKAGYNNSGCSGHKYTFEFVDPTELSESFDLVDGMLLISHNHTMGLLGSKLDLESTTFESRLVWHNPSAVNQCGCGDSFQISDGCSK